MQFISYMLVQFHIVTGNSWYTAISRKVVGKSARDNPKRFCGWFWVHCYSKKLGRVARETMAGTYVCLWVIKQPNKSRFNSYSVKKQCIDHTVSHINFRDCCVHIFSNNLSQNTCTMNGMRGGCLSEVQRIWLEKNLVLWTLR